MTKEVEYKLGDVTGRLMKPHHPNASPEELDRIVHATAAHMDLGTSEDFIRGWKDGYAAAARESGEDGIGAVRRVRGELGASSKDQEA